MPDKSIYILHKNGADSHYVALKYLLDKNQYELKFREFSVLSSMFKILFNNSHKSFKKQIKNLLFLISLIFSKNKKIVLGIAPFDPKIKLLTWLLKHHKVYYHTSWACWDGSFHPKRKKNTKSVMQCWKHFLTQQSVHIFTVTQKSKEEIIKNFNVDQSKVSVVYHALHPAFSGKVLETKRENLSFLYYGRLLPQKGIDELLRYFATRPDAKITFIGKGKELNKIMEFSQTHQNINYLGYIKDRTKLIEQIQKNQYLILNSKRTKKWEELFGLVIIECMSQGTIPVATNHVGPKEIITEDVGILCQEGQITNTINELITNHRFDVEISKNAIKYSKRYLVENIAERWRPILD